MIDMIVNRLLGWYKRKSPMHIGLFYYKSFAAGKSRGATDRFQHKMKQGGGKLEQIFKDRQKVWSRKNIDIEEVGRLAENAGISRLLAKVFISRGVADANAVREFLGPDIAAMHDPFLMDGMEAAADRIERAVNNRERILLFGDYDVDGVVAVSILYRFLLSVGADAQYFLPDRMEDGYGLTASAIEKASGLNASLVITADCGISSLEEVSCLMDAGVDVIVTDHHECGEALPNAVAVLNPRKPGCGYPFKELCGAGVVLKLIHGLCIRSGSGGEFNNFLDLTALATIADVVPLLGENRIIAGLGLKAIGSTQNKGLTALIGASGMRGKPINSYAAAFALAPRVNAAGRLGSAVRAVRLFTTDDRLLAETLAKELDEENRNRQDTENRILEEAVSYVEERLDAMRQKVLVVVGEGWHHGVIGIVASKLLDRYNRPCIVISVENGMGKGSGRSIKAFNLFRALTLFDGLLSRYGGHEMAAGLEIPAENIDEFRARINEYADTVLTDADLLPCIMVDAFLERGDITLENARELSAMEPYGEANPRPAFGYLAFSIADVRALSGGKHLKLRLNDAGLSVEGIGFNLGSLAEGLVPGDVVDAVFIPDVNVWNETERLQLVLKDLKPCIYAELDKNIVFNKSNDYNSYNNLQEISSLRSRRYLDVGELVPDRAELEAVYKYIRACEKAGYQLKFDDLFALSALISERYNLKTNFFKLKRLLEIFDDLGLLKVEQLSRRAAAVKIMKEAAKADLESSRLYMELQHLKEQQIS